MSRVACMSASPRPSLVTSSRCPAASCCCPSVSTATLATSVRMMSSWLCVVVESFGPSRFTTLATRLSNAPVTAAGAFLLKNRHATSLEMMMPTVMTTHREMRPAKSLICRGGIRSTMAHADSLSVLRAQRVTWAACSMSAVVRRWVGGSGLRVFELRAQRVTCVRCEGGGELRGGGQGLHPPPAWRVSLRHC